MLETGAVDTIVCGEGEVTLLELVNALRTGSGPSSVSGLWYREDGEVRQTPPRAQLNPDTLPLADFTDLISEESSRAWVGFPVHGSRGCVNTCSFCNSRRHVPRFRQRSVDHIVAELRRDVVEYRVKRIAFTDNLVNGNPRMFKQLCRAIRDADLEIELFGSLSLMPSVDPEMLDLMQDAGFRQVMLALESPAPRVRRDMGKWDDEAGVQRILQGCVDREIKPWIYLMHSFPTEGERDFLQLLYFVDDWDPEDFGGVLTWPFRLADVQIGEIDMDFVDRFDIQLLAGEGVDVSRYWTVFGKEPRWRTRWVDEEIRAERQSKVEAHIAAWRGE
jgi:radical SAM superfamily enzyme YgiQ (UPF0313 family)